MKTAFFVGQLGAIGGIETALINTSDWFKNEQITFVSKAVDFETAIRLGKKHTLIIDNDNANYTCDVAIYSSFDAKEIYRKRVAARKRYLVVHADWASLKKYPRWSTYAINSSEFDKIIAVSKTAQEGLLKAFAEPIKSVVIKNPPAKNEPDRALIFLTLSRGTKEKGMERIALAAQKFREAGRPFFWIIAGDQHQSVAYHLLEKMPNVVLLPPSRENNSLIKSVDYVVQLSESESYCYSVHEALAAGTPVICTRIPELERVVEHGENGYLTDLNLSDLDVDKIFEKVPKFSPVREKLDPRMEKLIKGEL